MDVPLGVREWPEACLSSALIEKILINVISWENIQA